MRRVALIAGVAVALLVGPLTVAAASPPVLTWAPSSGSGTYDFGTVTPGQTSTVQFRLANSGGSSTSALTVSLAGSSAFTVTSNGCANASLSPGRWCLVAVRYAPTTGGASDDARLSAIGRKPAVSSTLSLHGTSVRPRQIYWATTNDTMARANVDGTGTNLNFITGPFGEHGIDLDAAHLYWVSLPFGIGRSDLDGQNIDPIFIASPIGFGLDVDATHIYWPYTDPDSALTGIARADIDGQNVDTTFITGTTDPFDVAVDASYIYWADCESKAIGRADLDGQNANPLFITVESCPVGLAVDGQHIYWTKFLSSSIGRADLNGGNVNESLIVTEALPFAIALDSTYVYWTNNSTGSIGRADLDGQHANSSVIVGAEASRGIAVTP